MNISEILILMQLATSLLGAVEDNPNLPDSFKERAFETANRAIAFGNQALEDANIANSKEIVDSQQTEQISQPEPTPKEQAIDIKVSNVSVNQDRYPQVSIKWDLNEPVDTRVAVWSDNSNKRIYSVQNINSDNRHSVSITGLSRSTNYLYNIEVLEDGVYKVKKNGQFETPPPASEQSEEPCNNEVNRGYARFPYYATCS